MTVRSRLLAGPGPTGRMLDVVDEDPAVTVVRLAELIVAAEALRLELAGEAP